ncbi:MAG TPA: ribosome small subunit-dependent GTPase A [Thermoanaerobaculia bacterium]|nr:ribosome small subunit-dependent GTPase A [Thermoanaerobaculia bacterium]
MASGPTGFDEDWDLEDDGWEEVDEIERRGRPRLKHELKSRKKTAPSEPPAVPLIKGVVFTTRKGRVRASVEGELVTCWLPADMASEQKSLVAVGDEIMIERRGQDCVVAEVLPRRSQLSRPDPFDPSKERVVAANIDVVVQVSAARNPPLKPGLIDRYLVAIEQGDAEPAICINKTDQLDQAGREELETILSDYRALAIPIVYCSASSGEGIERLRELVAGRTAVLVGHSGVGKSSLLNALDQSLQVVTRELHKEGTAGRHTTSSSTMYEFPDGTRLIDTPGIREFGLWEMGPRELRLYFPEFADLALECRYRDCTHLHEPDCAVRDASEQGLLPTGRYERYARMAKEL